MYFIKHRISVFQPAMGITHCVIHVSNNHNGTFYALLNGLDFLYDFYLNQSFVDHNVIVLIIGATYVV